MTEIRKTLKSMAYVRKEMPAGSIFWLKPVGTHLFVFIEKSMNETYKDGEWQNWFIGAAVSKRCLWESKLLIMNDEFFMSLKEAERWTRINVGDGSADFRTSMEFPLESEQYPDDYAHRQEINAICIN